MSSKLKIAQLIKDNHVEREEIAALLFPNKKQAERALQRVEQGKQLLDSNQLKKLADFLGLSVDDIYTSSWKQKHTGRVWSFTKGDYTATLNRDNWITKVSYKGEQFFEQVLTRSNVTVSAYLDFIDDIVANHKPTNK